MTYESCNEEKNVKKKKKNEIRTIDKKQVDFDRISTIN